MSRLSFVASVLEAGGVAKPRADVATLVAFVARRHGIEPAHIYGRSHRPEYAHPRQEVMFLADKAGHSQAAIGRALDRDHTTIIHGIRAHKSREGLK